MFTILLLAATVAGGGIAGPRTVYAAGSISVSKTANLNPEGEAVTVWGSGFDTSKGIYVALCVRPAPGAMPSPCGGGADLSGSGGASAWISSNPPSYGEGLAIPYGDGGSFAVTVSVGAMIGSVDCRTTQCAIVTRADHTHLSDRSQDVIIPVSFRATAAEPTAVPPTAIPPTNVPGRTPIPGATAPGAPTEAAAPTETATATPTATPTVAPRPSASISGDGRTATAGEMELRLSDAGELDPDGTRVRVEGAGYDTSIGIYVALCALPAGDAAPGPCASGSEDLTAWISSNPPDYGKELAEPYGDGGAFEVELLVTPVIDSQTDCREVACGIATRADDLSADVRSHDLWVPVSFGEAAEEPTTPAEEAPLADDDAGTDDGGGASTGLVVAVVGGIAAVAAIAGAAVYLVRRRAAGIATTTIAVIAVLLGACGGSSAAPPSATTIPDLSLPVTVESADGRSVTVTDASRIVSLWGNITETLFALDMGEYVVGRDITSTLPEASNLPVVTRAHDVSAEGVLSLNPTLVLGSLDNSGPDSAIEQIRNVGVPVILFEDPESVDDIIPRLLAIATAIGVPERGDALAEELDTALAQAIADVHGSSARPKVAFLYMRGQAGVYLLGGPGSGADSMIRAAGGLDAGTELGLEQAFIPITSEAMASAAPDVILMTTSGLDSVGGIDGLVKIPGIAQTPAGRDRRIVTLADEMLYNFGTRTPEAIHLLADAIRSTGPAGS